jgi:hypothetical protein
MILPQNFGILIPNSRSLVSPRSKDTLIRKNRLMALHESFYQYDWKIVHIFIRLIIEH